MVESCRDDPLLEANAIFLLEDAYRNYGLSIPRKVAGFLEGEKQRIAPLIEEMIKKKTYELSLWVDERDRLLRLQEEKEREKEEEMKARKLTRTQLIFGNGL